MRPTMDGTMLAVAAVLAKRGTCLKLQVGCVLCDQHGRVLSTGYNGVARGMPHCNQPGLHNYPHKCPGADAPAGADLCEAVHAEQNAMLQCRDTDRIVTCYTTVSPCQRCVKELLNTGCTRILFNTAYHGNPQAEALWCRAGREWLHTSLGETQC